MAAVIAEKITNGSEKREFLLACMRTVTAKLRAYQFEVETIGLALKCNRITNAEATEWLRESCLIDETMSSAVRNWDDQNGTATLPVRSNPEYSGLIEVGGKAPRGASGDGSGQNQGGIGNRPNGPAEGQPGGVRGAGHLAN